MATANATTDHDEIREWVEARGGHPARVKATGSRKDPGVLRIDFPGFSGEDTLEEIEWDEFFEWFDRNRLAALLSDEKGNRFNKLVTRKSPSRRVSKSPRKKATSSKKAANKSSSRRVASSKSSSRRVVESSRKTTSSRKATASKKATSSKKAASAKATPSKKASKKSASSKKSTSSKKATTPSKKAAVSRKSSSAKRSTKSAARSTSRKSSSTRRLGDSATRSRTTTNHNEIRKWVEARGGFPAHVKRTGRKKSDPGVLRIDYPGYSGGDTLERMNWDDWFEAFDDNKLAFLYQDKKNSRFSKLVAR